MPTFRSEYSDLHQGEDEARMKHLSLCSLASYQVLSLDLSVGATGLLVGYTSCVLQCSHPASRQLQTSIPVEGWVVQPDVDGLLH